MHWLSCYDNSIYWLFLLWKSQDAPKKASAPATKKEVESSDSSSDESESEDEKVRTKLSIHNCWFTLFGLSRYSYIFEHKSLMLFYLVWSLGIVMVWRLNFWLTLFALVLPQKAVATKAPANLKKPAKESDSDDESDEDSSEESDDEPKNKKIKVWACVIVSSDTLNF